ncbi:Ni/Co efflux regulator RcnB [Stenotrophomonas rhizophila]|uniref:Ni/Co efflux regulator RcnB n=2 Tax=Stenotrophomonas rhizophila TaxID=216778 RepID=A0AAW5PMY5_9GAMM|nr:Ni/Co efflux regulator RcnB [Stenotrophomonas rhizophila]
MNRFVVGAVASLLALGTVAPAFADDHRGRGHDRREWRDDRRDNRHDRHDRHDRREVRHDRRYDRRYDPRYDNRGYYRPGPPPPRVVYRPAPGYGSYGWARGHRYREYYGGPVYVVNDYSRYSVRRPPRDHHWIRDDRGNLLLVAIATGIIADYVINR